MIIPLNFYEDYLIKYTLFGHLIVQVKKGIEKGIMVALNSPHEWIISSNKFYFLILPIDAMVWMGSRFPQSISPTKINLPLEFSF